MARTAKKTKTVTGATGENAALDTQIRSVGDMAMEVVAALSAPELVPEPDMTAEVETVADMGSVAAESANAPEPEPAAESNSGA